MRFTRDEYLSLMTFQAEPSRQMFVELFGPLVGLEEQWRAEGAGDTEIDLSAFDWDFVHTVPCGANTGYAGARTRELIEDTASYRIERDELGRTVKLPKGYATIPLPLDYPVKDMASWLRIKPHFAFDESRINWRQVEHARRQRAAGALVVGRIPGAFDTPRQLMGDTAACTAFLMEPELIQDIHTTLRDTALETFARVSERLTIDQLSVHEDFAGRGGPLVGPDQVRECFLPYYRPVWDLLHARGARLFDLDSDGNIEAVIDALLDCGVNAMHPFEPAAGMDIVRTRTRYGSRLAVKGGIDKHVLRGARDDIRRELEYKMQPLMRRGGTVFGLDHRIPNESPLANYRYYVEIGRELLGLPPPRTPGGWARMAF